MRERRSSASGRKLHRLRMLAGVIAGLLVATGRVDASDDRSYIKSITFAGHTIDRTHSIGLRDWRIGFGRGRPFAEDSEQGMTLRGLNCTRAKAAAIKCRLFMSMQRFESFPHFCELSPDGHDAAGTRPIRFDCPNVIAFHH
jgi:hypothetical protein